MSLSSFRKSILRGSIIAVRPSDKRRFSSEEWQSILNRSDLICNKDSYSQEGRINQAYRYRVTGFNYMPKLYAHLHRPPLDGLGLSTFAADFAFSCTAGIERSGVLLWGKLHFNLNRLSFNNKPVLIHIEIAFNLNDPMDFI